VFSHVEKTMNDVDILQNMLDTRVKYGAKYECGDFYLPAEYQGIAITCAPATANGSGISAITKETVNGEEMWRVTVDPTKFASSESSQGIKVTVKKDGDTSDGQNRVLYVGCPCGNQTRQRRLCQLQRVQLRQVPNGAKVQLHCRRQT